MFCDLAKFCKKIGKGNGVICITTIGYLELIDQFKEATLTDMTHTEHEYQSVVMMIRKHPEWFNIDYVRTDPQCGRPPKLISLSEEGKRILELAKKAYRKGTFKKKQEKTPTITVREETGSDVYGDADITLTTENDTNPEYTEQE